MASQKQHSKLPKGPSRRTRERIPRNLHQTARQISQVVDEVADFLDLDAHQRTNANFHKRKFGQDTPSGYVMLTLGRDKTLVEDQESFLRAAAENPEVRLAERIKGYVYPTVFTARQKYGQLWGPEIPEGTIDDLIYDCLAELHLDYPWVFESAWQIIHLCEDLQLKPDQALVYHPFGQERRVTAPQPFLLPPWPAQCTERDYREFVTYRFRLELERYIEYVKKEKDVPDRPKRDRILTRFERYECAALRVCLQLSYDRIADDFNEKNEEGITAQAVEASVKKICKRLGLPT